MFPAHLRETPVKIRRGKVAFLFSSVAGELRIKRAAFLLGSDGTPAGYAEAFFLQPEKKLYILRKDIVHNLFIGSVLQRRLFPHMDAEVDFTETAQNLSLWLYKIPAQVFRLFPKGIGGLQAVAGIGKAGTGMQRRKGIGRVDRTGVDIPAYR